ncbi:MAG: flagellar motor switch protein FliN [Candidatus Aureabacteria bacterium]|nr:flagellar motor switch protein FliN [Candidatus Auribacterota bacterium]
MGEEEAKAAEETQKGDAAATQEEDGKATGQPAKFAPLPEGDSTGKKVENLDLILDVSTKVTVELGRTQMLIKDVLNMNIGSVIEINKLAGEPVDILVNDKLIAKGEVVVINENFGVRVTEILGAEQRIKKLGSKDQE